VQPETEAHLEGAANLWRYHVRGWVPFWLCVAGLVAVGLIGVGLNHLLAPPKVLPCGTINPTCALHHINYRVPLPRHSSIPTFTP
jgi:hypothetical protein